MADLRRGKKKYGAEPGASNATIADYCQVVGRLLSTELRFFTVIADKKWWFARNPGKTGDDLYATLFEEDLEPLRSVPSSPARQERPPPRA